MVLLVSVFGDNTSAFIPIVLLYQEGKMSKFVGDSNGDGKGNVDGNGDGNQWQQRGQWQWHWRW